MHQEGVRVISWVVQSVCLLWSFVFEENDQSAGGNELFSFFHHIRLSREFRADLAWWHTFISPWNGVGLLHHFEAEPDYAFTSGASSTCTWGCGAGIEISGSSLLGMLFLRAGTYQLKNCF